MKIKDFISYLINYWT